VSEDKEVAAMGTISQALTELPPNAVARVVRWAAERFGVTMSDTKKATQRGADASGPDEGHKETEFTDLASFYDAANPQDNGERVLVVAYWFQQIQLATELESQQINKELKQLGHGIDNITKAVSALTGAKPRLAIQIKKSGSTRQARKTFKLTTEGIKRVKTMLAGQES
jgi:hypothetical protein